MASKAPNKSSWQNNKVVIACQWVIIAGCVIVGFHIINGAFQEDARQENFSNKYYLPAVQDYQSRHYLDAVPKLQANLRAFPDDYKANFEMGLVLLKLDQKQEARTYFVSAQNSFLSHHGRFSNWERYNNAQHEITNIDHPRR